VKRDGLRVRERAGVPRVAEPEARVDSGHHVGNARVLVAPATAGCVFRVVLAPAMRAQDGRDVVLVGNRGVDRSHEVDVLREPRRWRMDEQTGDGPADEDHVVDERSQPLRHRDEAVPVRIARHAKAPTWARALAR
jgi:hypothetical protein